MVLPQSKNEMLKLKLPNPALPKDRDNLGSVTFKNDLQRERKWQYYSLPASVLSQKCVYKSELRLPGFGQPFWSKRKV